MPKFKDSSDREIIKAALQIAERVKYSVSPALKPNYDRFMLAMFDERARRLGMAPKPGESDDDRLLRPALVTAAAEHGDKDLIAQARELAARWLKDRKSVSPDIIATALDIAAAHGNRAFFNQLVNELKVTKDRRDRDRIVAAIGSFRDPEIAKSGLQLLLDPQLDIRDIDQLCTCTTPSRKPRMWHGHFWWRTTTGFSAGFPQGSVIMLERIYRLSGGAFCDEKGYSEVQNFFREKVKSMPGAEHSLDQVLERIQVCGPRRAAQRPEVSKFLANW